MIPGFRSSLRWLAVDGQAASPDHQDPATATTHYGDLSIPIHFGGASIDTHPILSPDSDSPCPPCCCASQFPFRETTPHRPSRQKVPRSGALGSSSSPSPPGDKAAGSQPRKKKNIPNSSQPERKGPTREGARSPFGMYCANLLRSPKKGGVAARSYSLPAHLARARQNGSETTKTERRPRARRAHT